MGPSATLLRHHSDPRRPCSSKTQKGHGTIRAGAGGGGGAALDHRRRGQACTCTAHSKGQMGEHKGGGGHPQLIRSTGARRGNGGMPLRGPMGQGRGCSKKRIQCPPPPVPYPQHTPTHTRAHMRVWGFLGGGKRQISNRHHVLRATCDTWVYRIVSLHQRAPSL